MEPQRSPSMRSVQWQDDGGGRRDGTERALIDRFFDQSGFARSSISPRASASGHHRLSTASGTNKHIAAHAVTPSVRSTACNTNLPQRGSITTTSNSGSSTRHRGQRQRRASRSPTRRPLPPPNPGSPAAATMQTIGAARLCGAVHQQSIPCSWKQELVRLRKAAAQWNDAQARHQCCRGLVAQVAGLLLVPDLQVHACALLADLGERWPPALAGGAEPVAAHLPLALGRPAARREALRLTAALAGSGETGRSAITASPQLLNAAMAPLCDALDALPARSHTSRPKAAMARGDGRGDEGGWGGWTAAAQKPGERWGGQREEAWGPGMSIDPSDRWQMTADVSNTQHSAATVTVTAVGSRSGRYGQAGGKSLEGPSSPTTGVEHWTQQAVGAPLFAAQQVPGAESGALTSGPGSGQGVDPVALETALGHAAGAARALIKLLAWRTSAIKVCQVQELAVDPVCRLFKALARQHLAAAAAATQAQAEEAEAAAGAEGAAGGKGTEVQGRVWDGSGSGRTSREARRRARAERKQARLRMTVLKLLLTCMQHMASLQAPCQRMVRTAPKGHHVLPLVLQLLTSAQQSKDADQADAAACKQDEKEAGAEAAVGANVCSNAVAAVLMKHGGALAACALRCLGSVGEQADGETRGALRDALSDDESGAMEALVSTLRSDPPRLRAASRAALLLWVAASGESAYVREELVTQHKALSAVADVLQLLLRGCRGGTFEVQLPPTPQPEPRQEPQQESRAASEGGEGDAAEGQGSHAGSEGGAGGGSEPAVEEPAVPPPPPPPPPAPVPAIPQDSFVLSADSDDEPVQQPAPAVPGSNPGETTEAAAGAAAQAGEAGEAMPEVDDSGKTIGPEGAAVGGCGAGEGDEGVGHASGAATPARQGSGDVQAFGSRTASLTTPGSRNLLLGDMASPPFSEGEAAGAGVGGQDDVVPLWDQGAGGQGGEVQARSEASGSSEEEDEDSESDMLGRPRSRRYGKAEVQQLLSNCLALASALLAVLGAGSAKRDTAAKAMARALPVVAAAAAACARDSSDATGGGWGLEVRERALAVLANMCLHEDTAIAAAHCAAAPVLAVEVVTAALEHLPAAAAPAQPFGRSKRSASSSAAAAAPSKQQPRTHSRSVLQAPASILTQAAAILTNYMRVQPSLENAARAAAEAETFEYVTPSALGDGAEGGGAGEAAAPLAQLPQDWNFEAKAALEVICQAVPGACSHVSPLETLPQPRTGPRVSASEALAPLTVAPSIAAATPSQLLLVQSLASAVACLSRGVVRGQQKRVGHVVTPAAGQAALLFADHVALACWKARRADAPRPEAAAAGQACVTACWALLACGYVHPELDGLLDKLLPSLAPLVKHASSKRLPEPWPVLLLTAQLCRSRRVAAGLLTHTPTAEALVAEQLRRGGGDGTDGLLLQVLMELRPVDRFKILTPLRLPEYKPPQTVESVRGKPAQRAFGGAPEGQTYMSAADLAPELAAMMAADPDRDAPIKPAAKPHETGSTEAKLDLESELSKQGSGLALEASEAMQGRLAAEGTQGSVAGSMQMRTVAMTDDAVSGASGGQAGTEDGQGAGMQGDGHAAGASRGPSVAGEASVTLLPQKSSGAVSGRTEGQGQASRESSLAATMAEALQGVLRTQQSSSAVLGKSGAQSQEEVEEEAEEEYPDDAEGIEEEGIE